MRSLHVTLAMIALCTAASIHAAQPTSPPAAPRLEVFVRDTSDHSFVNGADVRVVSKSGKVLARARTDSTGTASLPVLDSSADPDIILVFADPFYIGGTHWSAGARELCVDLVLWHTCDQVTIKAE